MKSWNKALLPMAVAAVVATPVQADTILGIYAGAQVWNQDGDGSFGNANQNTTGEVEFDKENQNVLYVAIEHPLPFVPNLKVKKTDLASKGEGNVDFTFESVKFQGDITTEVDFSHTDFILYYEILDNIVSLDVGVNVMQMDGFVEVKNTTQTERVDFDGYLPTLYLAAEASLPFTGLSIGGEISGLAAGGSSFYDYQVQIQYNVIDNLAIDVGLQVGYRATSLKLDDIDNLDTDISFSGPYAGIQVHF